MLDQIAHDIFKQVNDKLQQDGVPLKEGADRLRALLESQITKLNLVSREEFDAQSAVLARTREKVDALEKQIAELQVLLAQFEEKEH